MHYEVERRLGRGGMGVVDLAYSPDGTLVALKRLSLVGSADEMARARARIRREAEVLGALDHPAIVPLIEVVDDGDDVVLVMPYYSGGSLHDRVTATGPLHPNEVSAMADRLLDALAVAHRQGIVHRDIKPANVLFDARGDAHLVDFGVASSRDHTVGLTATEMVVGTPGFMAPEQARGEVATPASDVFSLGATLLYAATGAGPFGPAESDPRVLMHRAAEGRVERLPKTMPSDLRDRIGPMLDKAQARRPSAARARGGPAGTWPVTGLRRAVDRHRVASLVSGVLVVLLVTAAAVAVLAGGDGGGGPIATPSTRARPTTASTSTTVACDPLPYRPCTPEGPGSIAPGTDGTVCVEDRDDYDGDAANGCEAVPDAIADGTEIPGNQVAANLVPRDDVDTWEVPVTDNFQFSCDGSVGFTLTAPAGASLRMEVLDGTEVLGRTTSADGVPGTVRLREQNCFGDDSTILTLRVSSIGSDHSAEDYTITRAGSF